MEQTVIYYVSNNYRLVFQNISSDNKYNISDKMVVNTPNRIDNVR